MLSLKKHRGPFAYYADFKLKPISNLSIRWFSADESVYWITYDGLTSDDWLSNRVNTSKEAIVAKYNPTFTIIKNKAYYIDLLDKFTESLHNTLRLSSSTTGN